MPRNSLLVCDFDGVVLDGINEYWWSSCQAFLALEGEDTYSLNYSQLDHVPDVFRKLRPWVHHGWEMVLLVAEIVRSDSLLNLEGINMFLDDYQKSCSKALNILQWTPEKVQLTLDEVRKKAISIDFNDWLSKHQVFPHALSRLQRLGNEGVDLAILTTKNTLITRKLLDAFSLEVEYLYGYESGSKVEILQKLALERTICGFLEDRRSTLESVLDTSALNSIPCYLASWGYLRPEDRINLPSGISLLEIKTLATPLASWP